MTIARTYPLVPLFNRWELEQTGRKKRTKQEKETDRGHNSKGQKRKKLGKARVGHGR